jgi:hypothetical protein
LFCDVRRFERNFFNNQQCFNRIIFYLDSAIDIDRGSFRYLAAEMKGQRFNSELFLHESVLLSVVGSERLSESISEFIRNQQEHNAVDFSKISPVLEKIGFNFPLIFQKWVDGQIDNIRFDKNDSFRESSTLHNDSSFAGNNNIEASTHEKDSLLGMTLGGIVITEKQKQKRRMKPNLVASTLASAAVQSSDLFSAAQGSIDIRSEFKISSSERHRDGSLVVPPSSPTVSAVTSRSNEQSQSSSSSRVADSSSAIPFGLYNALPSGGDESENLDDLLVIQRTADIYAALVLQQYISVHLALSLLFKIVGVYLPATANFYFLLRLHDEHFPSVIISWHRLLHFQRRIITALLPMIRSCGRDVLRVLLAAPIMKDEMFLSVHNELAAAVTFTDNNSIGLGLVDQNSVYFKLPESFVKPFREEFDSRNEYTKSHVSLFILFCFPPETY